MEGIVFDLKPKLQTEGLGQRKLDTTREKDFLSTMESTIEKNKEILKKEEANKNNTIENENPTIKEHKLDKNENKEEESIEIVETLDEEKIVYDSIFSMINLNLEKNVDLDQVEIKEDLVVALDSLTEDLAPVIEEAIELEQQMVENISEDSGTLVSKNENLENTKEPTTSSLVEELQTKEQPKIETNKNLELTKENTEENVNTVDTSKPVTEIIGENLLDKEDNSNTSSKKENTTDLSFESEIEVKKENKTEGHIFTGFEKEDIVFSSEPQNNIEENNPIDKKEVIEQIVEKMQFDLSDGKNEIRIKLKPEILGDMTMNLEVAKGAITAKIMVENMRTKEIIEANLLQLKEEIEDRGMQIKTFEVFVGNDADFDRHSFNQFNFNQNNKRLRLNNKNNKFALNYDENQVQNSTDKTDIYSENSLNLMA